MTTTPAESTEPQKVTRSYTEFAEPTVPFGASSGSVRPIDSFSHAPGYDDEAAYLMAVISAWAYADERVLAAKLRYYGLAEARVRRVTVQNNALLVVTTAYLIQSASGRTAVLAFRGTDPGNLVTMLTDTQLMMQTAFGSAVHSGFYASVEVVWDELHAALKAALDGYHVLEDRTLLELPSGLENLYVTGHSLGGAMAVLASARLFEPDYARVASTIRGVYTYGQPMVGDRAFAAHCQRKFGDRLFRHVYRSDVVPHLPPRSQLDYAHAGPEWRARSLRDAWTKSETSTPRTGLVAALASVLVNAIEVRTFSRDLFPGLSIDDHMPHGYLEVSRYAHRVARRGTPAASPTQRVASATRSLLRRVGLRRSGAKPIAVSAS